MNNAALAPAVAPADVTGEADRFRCAPYRCVLSASSCLSRQEKTRELGPVTARLDGFEHCVDCADGRLIALRLNRMPAERPMCSARSYNGQKACARVAVPGSDVCEWHRRAQRRAKAPEQLARERVEAPRDVGPALPPLVQPTKERPTMATCEHPGCNARLLPGKLKEPPPPGTEGLCFLHRKAKLTGIDPEAERERRRQSQARFHGKTDAPPPQARKPASPQARKPAKRLPQPSGSVAGLLAEQLVEAHRLVMAMGWDTARAIVAALEARST